MLSNKDGWLTEILMMKVRKYARRINVIKTGFADVSDIEQDLLCDICNAMKYFDSERGSIDAFTEGVLRKRSKNYLRDFFTVKRGKEIHFESFEYNEENGRQIADANYEWADRIITRIDVENSINRLSLLQLRIYVMLKSHSIIDIAKSLHLPYASLHLEVQKIRECIKYENNFQKNLVNGEYIHLKGVKMKNLAVLETLSAKEISMLDVYDLMDLHDQVTKLTNHAKELKEKLDDSLNLRFAESVKNSLRSENKDTGTTKFFDGAFQIVAEVPKKVTWDNEKMEELVKRIPDEQRKSFVKIAYSIEERKYSALPHNYQELFKEARTITPGKIKFQINFGENNQ